MKKVGGVGGRKVSVRGKKKKKLARRKVTLTKRRRSELQQVHVELIQ